MKKLALFTGFFALAGLLAAPASAQSFPDVAEDHPNYAAIEELDERGIISGYDDGIFRPDNLVNRAEAVKIIVSAFGIDHDAKYEESFPDVPEDQWFFKFVMAASDAGLVNGYDDGDFRPENEVNLAESLKILVEATDVELPKVEGEKVFEDVLLHDWYSQYALYARNANVVISDDLGKIYADKSMTRAAFAELIYRMLIVQENDGEAYPLNLNWPYYEAEALPFKMQYDSATWQVSESGNEVVFLHPDEEFLQFSGTRIYPKTGLVKVVWDDNPLDLTKDQYFQNVQLAFPGSDFMEFEFGGMTGFEVIIPDDRIVDWYLYLEDGSVLAIYTQFGDGAIGYKLQQFIKTMVASVEYRDVDLAEKVDYSELLSTIFANVLVENKGMEMIGMMPEDRIIIETDTIGVGNGPVDYYFSAMLNYTLKYDRHSDSILDTRKGETSAF